MHAFSRVICICIRVAAEVEEIVYEVVAEPQGQAPVHILLFPLITPIYVSITCALGLGIV